MQYLQANLLSIITLLPALGALVLLFIPEADQRRTTFRYGALGVALLTFVLSLLLLPGFQSDGQLHYVIDLPWITTIGARYMRDSTITRVTSAKRRILSTLVTMSMIAPGSASSSSCAPRASLSSLATPRTTLNR